MSVEQHVSVDEVAERLQVHRDRVCRMIARQEIRAVRIGRQYRIAESAVEEFLQGHCTIRPARR